MKLSVVTINYNDAVGLMKTLESVATQKPCDCEVEHIVIDGGSTDTSVEVIKQYPHVTKWVSEKDNGIYDAMNKGIEIALGRRKVNDFNRSELVEDKNKGIKMTTGDYIQILNAGDILASNDVLARMSEFLNSQIRDGKNPGIIYGNMLKAMPNGELVRDNCGGPGIGNSFLYFYRGTLNHDCAWIKRELFERFGLYNEEMRICSDWEWYIRAIVFGGVKPVYVDIDVTVFDMNGISESGGKNKAIIQKERRGYLEQILPASVLADYDKYAFDMQQMDKLREHKWAYKLVWTLERVLNRLDKMKKK